MARAIGSTRRSLRSAITLPAGCQRPWGRIETVMLTDVSIEGCRVVTNGDRLSRGAKVLIRTSSLLGASGIVRWANAATAGIEFDCPLPAEILKHLERHHGDGTTLIIPNLARRKIDPPMQQI